MESTIDSGKALSAALIDGSDEAIESALHNVVDAAARGVSTVTLGDLLTVLARSPNHDAITRACIVDLLSLWRQRPIDVDTAVLGAALSHGARSQQQEVGLRVLATQIKKATTENVPASEPTPAQQAPVAAQQAPTSLPEHVYNLLPDVLSLLARADTSVGSAALDILVILGTAGGEVGRSALASCAGCPGGGGSGDDLAVVVDSVPAYEARVLELTARIGAFDADALAWVAKRGLLNRFEAILVEADGAGVGDPLMAVTAIELAGLLADAICAHSYLFESGLSRAIIGLFGDAGSDPIVAALCGPYAMAFLVRLLCAGARIDQLESSAPFGHALAAIAAGDAGDMTLRHAAIEACAGILGSAASVVWLLSPSLPAGADIGTALVAALVSCVRPGDTRLQAHTLQSLGRALQSLSNGGGDVADEDAATLLVNALHASGAGLLGVVYDCCRNPFGDVQDAARFFADGIAQTQTGRSALVAHPGLVEMLLDRTTATSHASRQQTYVLLRRLGAAPSAPPSALTEEIKEAIAAYVREGVVGKAQGLEVAVARGP